MSSSIIALMLTISTILGFLALFGLLWGLKTKQFDDYSKFLDGTKFDSEDALNDAYKMEKKKEKAIKKKKEQEYFPPD